MWIWWLYLGVFKRKFEVQLAIDHDPYCEQVYKKNLPTTNFVLQNLSQINKKIFLGLKPDVVVGGPPCQGFSTIGSRISSIEKKREKKDIRNNLVFSFIEHVNYLNPKIFLMENVSGILTRDKGEIFHELTKKIKKFGYKYEVFKLDAVNYGVPQFRKRVFIIGTKEEKYEINLGLGLTNEQGASIKIVSPSEIEGMRNVGSFCYFKPNESYPVYFVAKFSKPSNEYGIWKNTRKYKGVEGQWMPYNGKKRLYKGYKKEIIGDSIGAYMSYDFKEPTQVVVKIGVSYVSIDNARENLEKETDGLSFDEIQKETARNWDELLSKIKVEGGTKDDKTIFYTALYHTLIHPNTLNDVNGEYPKMATRETLKTKGTRFTVFSFWDTYRNLHSLMSLVYPKQQSDMVKSMLSIYDESGWLPKWELNATETTTMVGDPAGIVIADTYLRGIQDFDIEKAYRAMIKSATQLEKNALRPGIKEYTEKGYLTTASTKSGSVSTTQEYNTSDFAIAQLAKVLGKKEDEQFYRERSISYRKLFDKEFNLLRPKDKDDLWITPFNPETGANFQKNLGFIEGNSWQYTFMLAHDTKGLINLMGGEEVYSKQLQKVFNTGQFDMANEPDIGYPYLFNFVKGEEWRTQEKVSKLINQYFKNTPEGLPGNDDTGTMSAWLIYSMMGIYPISPAEPSYTITRPVFDKITIQLDSKYYKNKQLIIEKKGQGKIDKIQINGKTIKSYFISHASLVNGYNLKINLQ